MAKHNETGIKGEQIAENFLLKNGYTILHRNWCCDKKEVDIIALKNDTLRFIEVKTRHNTRFGFPEDAVNAQKAAYLKTAAELYLSIHPMYEKIQFDIISVLIKDDACEEIVFFEDAFY